MNIKKKEGEMLKYGGEIPTEIMFKLREDAKADCRPVSSLILRIMKKHLNNQDYIESF